MPNDKWEKRQDAQDIRQDHAEQKQAADQFVTEQQAIALVGHVGELTGEVKELRRDVTERNLLLRFGVVAVLVFGAVFVTLLFLSLNNQAVLKQQGQIHEAVTGCTIEDTQAQCRDKQTKRSYIEGIGRLKAVECIERALDAKESTQKCYPPPPEERD